jgi:hypothetical protein
MSIESRTNKKGERRYEVRLRDPNRSGVLEDLPDP